MRDEPPRIAIVDDDADVRLALERLLCSAGFAVQVCASGEELMAATVDAPDCVVLDLHMPGLSGFDVQARLAEVRPALPVVVITGHDTPESRARALGQGAAAYLCKPVDDEALLAAIDGAIGAGRITKETPR